MRKKESQDYTVNNDSMRVFRPFFNRRRYLLFQDEKDATGESSGMVSRSQSTNVSDKQLQSKILEMQRVKCVESMQSDKSSGKYNNVPTFIRVFV